MATSLFRYERIKTTKAKALAVRRTAEKMITRAKTDSVHNRRIIAKDIQDKEILAKLFTDIGPRFKERPGGYTRILKLGYRQGDAAEMVLLELVQDETETKKKSSRKIKAKKTAVSAKGDAKPGKKEAVSGVEESVEEKAEQALVEQAAEESPAEAVETDSKEETGEAEEGSQEMDEKTE
jgi:large subunit ribosomal protein L17